MGNGSILSIAKYLIFFSNLLFVILGILLITFGFTVVESTGEVRISLDAPRGAYIALIVIGVAIFLVSFLGCCGAIRESHCMLISFSSFIFLLLIVELIAAGFVYKFRSHIYDAAIEEIRDEMNHYGSKKVVTDLVDDLQTRLDCCGATDVHDWKKTPYFTKNGTYPLSCCEESLNTCSSPTRSTPCASRVVDHVRRNASLLASTALVASLVQLLAIIVSVTLARQFKKGYEVV